MGGHQYRIVSVNRTGSIAKAGLHEAKAGGEDACLRRGLI